MVAAKFLGITGFSLNALKAGIGKLTGGIPLTH
jgi:hypothetical protein